MLVLMSGGVVGALFSLTRKIGFRRRVQVEGPYGKFDFHSGKENQIWVAGGIGITPFISRMEDLADSSQHNQIDLFYSTDMPDDHFLETVKKRAELANINLHVISPKTDGFVDTNLITRLVPEWKKADIWFCGPSKFGESIKNGFTRPGLGTKNFHQELFEMR